MQEFYQPVHGYLSLIVCVFGTLTNLLNIIVLTHKDLRGNPINLILTGIAVADILVMAEYIPFSFHLYLLTGRTADERVVVVNSFRNGKIALCLFPCSHVQWSWSWGVFMWVHVQFTNIIHTVSIWLTLSLAVWRFIMIKFATMAVAWCTLTRCKVVLILGFGEYISLFTYINESTL